MRRWWELAGTVTRAAANAVMKAL
eukprot:SAG11_NODE_16121_length_556_cov_1.126915_1_plen_23_part_10